MIARFGHRILEESEHTLCGYAYKYARAYTRTHVRARARARSRCIHRILLLAVRVHPTTQTVKRVESIEIQRTIVFNDSSKHRVDHVDFPRAVIIRVSFSTSNRGRRSQSNTKDCVLSRGCRGNSEDSERKRWTFLVTLRERQNRARDRFYAQERSRGKNDYWNFRCAHCRVAFIFAN